MNKGGPRLPAVTSSGTGVAKKGVPRAPGVPGLSKSTTGKGGALSTLVQRGASKAHEVVNRRDVSLPIILDKTASTGGIQAHFISHSDSMKGTDDNEKRSITPIVMNGNGVSVGNTGDTSVFSSSNVAGPAQVNRAILEAAKKLQANHVNVVVIMTDTHDEHGNNNVGEQLGLLNDNDAMLLIILEQTHNGSVDKFEEYYRGLYGNLGDNLVIATGEFDAGDLVNAFVSSKGSSGGAASTANLSNVGGLPGIPATGRVSIGDGTKTLRIGNNSK